MSFENDTIYALSSGAVPSGVAVIRLSGSNALRTAQVFCGRIPEPRMMEYVVLKSRSSGDVLDRGMVCAFPGPGSFTGEDCCEFHLHGGPAVVRRFMAELSEMEGLRMADAGEFSRRAFDNGKLDLTGAEGLADLISAETELQRRQALRQAGGAFAAQLEAWRSDIIRARALIETEFDFSDEDDVPDSMVNEVLNLVQKLAAEMKDALASAVSGEIVRSGYKVALAGPPNAGKSSLLNALAKRDAAIVSDKPGTTRDVIEVKLDIAGLPVILSDTAGMRETGDEVEREGIRRTLRTTQESDLVLWLRPSDDPDRQIPNELDSKKVVVVTTKRDLANNELAGLSVSTVEKDGLSDLIEWLGNEVSDRVGNLESALITRERHRLEVTKAIEALEAFLVRGSDRLDIGAESLRLASEHLGRIAGWIDVEDLLDVIFIEFCVGK